MMISRYLFTLVMHTRTIVLLMLGILATGFWALASRADLIAAEQLHHSIVPDKKQPERLNQQDLVPVQKDGDQFINPVPRYERTFFETLSIVWKFGFANPKDNEPELPIPINTLTTKQLIALSDDDIHIIRLGHSTLLIKLYGEYWITDPMFSERASPFQSVGPKRFHQPPINWLDIINTIPLAGILISHNHYDHLDEWSIKQLVKSQVPLFVPDGVGDLINKWGINRDQIYEFKWWEQLSIGGTQLTATPSQHFSGRGFHDTNETLWLSWVIEKNKRKIFFSGDGGYFDGFKTIGDYFEGIDITLMEAGAYNPQWFDMHLFPEQTVQAHIDIQGDWLIPIHNGTFDLSMHPWIDPFEKIKLESDNRNVNALFPVMGSVMTFKGKENQPLAYHHPSDTTLRWWRGLNPSSEYHFYSAKSQ